VPRWMKKRRRYVGRSSCHERVWSFPPLGG
jgi:hypothetical protein